MAPTRLSSSSTKASARSTKRSPSRSPASSSGVSKPGPGRNKNDWSAERRRKAVRFYFFTTLTVLEIGQVLGGDYSKSDNERRIRELFLEGEVPSRSIWGKHTTAGHQNSIEQWNTFRQYKVKPWKRSRHPQIQDNPVIHDAVEANNAATSATPQQTQNDHVQLDLSTIQPGLLTYTRYQELYQRSEELRNEDEQLRAAGADSRALKEKDDASQRQMDEQFTSRLNQLGKKYLLAHLGSIKSVYRHSFTSTVRSSWISLSSTFRSSETSSIWRQSFVQEVPSAPSESFIKKRDISEPKFISSTARITTINLPSGSSLQHNADRHPPPPNPPVDPRPLLAWSEKSAFVLLNKEEQWAWDILVDESQLGESLLGGDDMPDDEQRPIAMKRTLLRSMPKNKKFKVPSFSRPFLELELRPCGGQHLQNSGMIGDCTMCGCSTYQVSAHVHGIARQEFSKLQLDHRDHYDNTVLFYYVTSRYFTTEGLKSLVAKGANVMVQNSSGASFMHCIDWNLRRWQPASGTPEPIRKFLVDCDYFDEIIELVEFLASMKFPFFHRNEHGQTVAHLLFDHMYTHPDEVPSIGQLDRILTALNPDINALDNHGHCVGQYLDLKGPTFRSTFPNIYKSLIVKFSQAHTLNTSNLMLDFKRLFISVQRRGQSWPKIVETLGYAHLIDAKGDSPLTTMLKVWDESFPIRVRSDYIEKLLKLGTGIHVKDRRGNTALAIAIRRGFRASVEQLLEFGANPNAVNYSGRSIMYMTKGWMTVAKKLDVDGIRYARIASCMQALHLSYAIFEPSTHQQSILCKRTKAKPAAAGQHHTGNILA